MKKSLFFILLSVSLTAGAQGWVYSEEFRTDIWTQGPAKDVTFVDCNTGSRSVQSTGICMRRDGANGFDNPTFITSKMTNTNGLYNKVAKAIADARPKRGTSSHSSTPTSAAQAQKMGKNYNHQTSAAGQAWRAQKREQQLEAQREAAERKQREKIMQKIADDNRAAAVTAQTNAVLQQQTNQRIARDNYHANEGARIAQQNARQAHHMAGPQFNSKKPKMTGQDKARMLRGQNKPRRIMYPQTPSRNTARKQLAQVERQPTKVERASALRNALMVRAELQRKKKAEQTYANYKGIKLDDHAVSTLGKDWYSDDFKTGPLAPPPTTRVVLTTQEKIKMMLDEFFGPEPPMTPEERRRLINEEFLGES